MEIFEILYNLIIIKWFENPSTSPENDEMGSMVTGKGIGKEESKKGKAGYAYSAGTA